MSDLMPMEGPSNFEIKSVKTDFPQNPWDFTTVPFQPLCFMETVSNVSTLHHL